jgi:predicted lipid-binding transport protein (Tim44 family)
MQQPAGGGFLRGMAGGIVGGLLGGMLFSSLGLAGTGGGMGGSGFGLIEILLLCGLGYIIYSMVKKRKESALAYQGTGQQGSTAPERVSSYGSSVQAQPNEDVVTTGIAHIQQMDPSFSEERFSDTAMDIFFKIQGAWTNRNLSSANMLITDEMRGIFQQDIDQMLRDKKVNRLENIAVRNVEIVEAWQESGQDYVKAVFTANLLDYTTDDATGNVIAGSKTEPVKFEECWTFTRPVGNNPWKLSAISQV